MGSYLIKKILLVLVLSIPLFAQNKLVRQLDLWDTSDSLNTRVDSLLANMPVGGAADSVLAHRTELNAEHDTTTAVRTFINANRDSITQHRSEIGAEHDTTTAVRIFINLNRDSLTSHNTRILAIRDSLNNIYTESQVRSVVDDSLNSYGKYIPSELATTPLGTARGIAVLYSTNGQYITSVPITIDYQDETQLTYLMDFNSADALDIDSLQSHGWTSLDSLTVGGYASIQGFSNTTQTKTIIDDSLNSYTKYLATEVAPYPAVTPKGIAVFYDAAGQYVTSSPITVEPNVDDSKYNMEFSGSDLLGVDSLEWTGTASGDTITTNKLTAGITQIYGAYLNMNQAGDYGYIGNWGSNGGLKFYSDGTEFLSISKYSGRSVFSNCDVGIGTTSPTSKLTVEGGVNADSVSSGYFNGRDSSYFFKWDPFIPISSPEADGYLIDMWTTKGIHIDSICVATFDSTIHGVRFWWGTALNSMPNAIIADSAREILGDGVMNVTGTWFSGDDLSNKDIPVNSFIQVVTTGTAGVHQEKLFIKIRGWWY